MTATKAAEAFAALREFRRSFEDQIASAKAAEAALAGPGPHWAVKLPGPAQTLLDAMEASLADIEEWVAERDCVPDLLAGAYTDAWEAERDQIVRLSCDLRALVDRWTADIRAAQAAWRDSIAGSNVVPLARAARR